MDGHCTYSGCTAPCRRFPTLPEAIQQGQEAIGVVDAHADHVWKVSATGHIQRMDRGHTFIAEEVVIHLAEEGLATSNAKAIGAVIQRAARAGLIVKTGHALPARTSHGSLKPEWRRA